MVNLVTMHPQIMKHWKLKGISLLLACLLQKQKKQADSAFKGFTKSPGYYRIWTFFLSSTQNTVYSARTLFAPKGALPWWCQWERSCLSWVLDECSPSKFAPPWRPYVSFCAAAANLCAPIHPLPMHLLPMCKLCAPNQCAPLYIPYQCTSYQCATLCTPRYLLNPYTFFWTQVHSRILYHRHYNLDNARNLPVWTHVHSYTIMHSCALLL